MVDEQGLLPLQQIDREQEAPVRNEGATIIRHVGENSTFVLPALEIEAADYAFRLRSSSYGGQVGSNPPYGLASVAESVVGIFGGEAGDARKHEVSRRLIQRSVGAI
jgi:hypothetical protein